MTTATFPFDPTGVAATNLITAELQPIQAFNYENSYLIVPLISPFYAAGLIVQYSDDVNPIKTLIEGTDYLLVMPYWGATRSIGKPVYGGISLLNTTVTGIIELQYQTIGGIWTANREYILTNLAEQVYNYGTVLWDELTNAPTCFPPIDHQLDISDTFGLDSLNNIINELSTAISGTKSNSIVYLLNDLIAVPTGEYAPLVNNVIPLQYIPSLSNVYATLTSLGLINISQLPNLSSFYAAITSGGILDITAIPNLSSLYAALTSSGTIAVKQIPNLSSIYASLGSIGTISVSEVPDLSSLYVKLVNGKVPCQNLYPCINTYLPSITGPISLGGNTVGAYTISNYSSFINYVVTAISGTVTISGDTITYTAPLFTGNDGFILNGTTFNVSVTGLVLDTPSITSPVNSSTGITINNLLLTSNAFTITGGTDTQASASWELATDSAFTTIVQSSMASTTNLTSWTVTSLVLDTVYYARVLYTGVTGESSAYSSTVYFTTETSSLPTSLLAELTASNGAANDYFGIAIAVNSTGTIAIIGALGKQIGNNVNQGAAYIFENISSVWTQIAELVASNGAANDQFGSAVSIDAVGDVVIIGAFAKTIGTNTYQGSAYIFHNVSGAWTQMAELTTTNGATNDNFGYSVAVNYDGTVAIIGARNKTVGSIVYEGAAFIFENVSSVWTQIAELVASNGAANEFGNSVSINSNGTIAIIGTPYFTAGSNTHQGAAYIFSNVSGVWVQVAELLATNGAANDYFGLSVAINSTGDTAIIGAYNKTVSSNASQGSVYVFQNLSGTWTQMAELISTDGAANDWFGYSVAVNSTGNVVIIGASNKTIGSNTKQGSSYIFQLVSGVWSQITELVNSTGAAYDNFGYSVAVDSIGDIAAVADPYATIGTNGSQGAVFIA